MEQVREIFIFERYFQDFISTLSLKVKNKVVEVLFLITVAERIPTKFFKHIEGTEGLYEIRVEYAGNIYRIFCCFDEGKLIVLFNGFQKKSAKTPPSEMAKALRIKDLYFKMKEGNGKRK